MFTYLGVQVIANLRIAPMMMSATLPPMVTGPPLVSCHYPATGYRPPSDNGHLPGTSTAAGLSATRRSRHRTVPGEVGPRWVSGYWNRPSVVDHWRRGPAPN